MNMTSDLAYSTSILINRKSNTNDVRQCENDESKKLAQSENNLRSSCMGYKRQQIRYAQGRTQGGVLGLNPPPLSLIFYKILLPAQRRLIVFAYFLLVNLST